MQTSVREKRHGEQVFVTVVVHDASASAVGGAGREGHKWTAGVAVRREEGRQQRVAISADDAAGALQRGPQALHDGKQATENSIGSEADPCCCCCYCRRCEAPKAVEQFGVRLRPQRSAAVGAVRRRSQVCVESDPLRLQIPRLHRYADDHTLY